MFYVWQVQFTIVNMFTGLIWFILPALLVVANDIFAYISGFFFGRKFFNVGLIALSPKKTWEGFIGATIITFFFGFTLSWGFAQFDMFTCPKSVRTSTLNGVDVVEFGLFLHLSLPIPTPMRRALIGVTPRAAQPTPFLCTRSTWCHKSFKTHFK